MIAVLSFGTIFATLVFSVTISAVLGGFDALVSLLRCYRMLSKDSFALSVVVFLGKVDCSVMALFFRREASSRSSRLVTSTDYATFFLFIA